MSTEKKNSPKPVGESKTPDKSPNIIQILEDASNSKEFDGFSDEQKEVALEMAKKMFERFPKLDFPHLNDDGTIDMDLMNGEHLHIGVPKGTHVVSAKREMNLCGEKGDKDEMLPGYVMAACATYKSEPVSYMVLLEELSARDFNNVLGAFQSANLL